MGSENTAQQSLQTPDPSYSIAVVIPCYKASSHIFEVLGRIGPEIHRIYVVDDKCPEKTGSLVEAKNPDPRIQVIFHPTNLGVGGASLTGFHAALRDGFDIVVKLDSDGQMDPALIPLMVEPLQNGRADFTKGNRFFSPQYLRKMPAIRLAGNAGISFIAKVTTGYWNVMDTTNGYFAFHTALLPFLEAEKIEKRFFFENDLLYRLCLIRGVVHEVPMSAHYGSETSNLSVSRSLLSFPGKFLKRFASRIFHRYFLRDFNAASLMMIFGLAFSAGGAGFGLYKWHVAESAGITATSGTVMLAGLPVILGFQMLLYAVLFDLTTVPTQPIHPALRRQQQTKARTKPKHHPDTHSLTKTT